MCVNVRESSLSVMTELPETYLMHDCGQVTAAFFYVGLQALAAHNIVAHILDHSDVSSVLCLTWCYVCLTNESTSK